MFNERASIEIIGLKQAMYLDIEGDQNADLTSLRVLTGDNVLLTSFIEEDHRLRLELPDTTKRIILRSRKSIGIRALCLHILEL